MLREDCVRVEGLISDFRVSEQRGRISIISREVSASYRDEKYGSNQLGVKSSDLA